MMSSDLWYSLPLVVAISLVYAGTRHEAMGDIIRHAIRFALWSLVILSGIFALLYFVSENL
ncbi:MAG: hypothetical protein K2Y37_03210 [Pirellulales bacterium]|nr:hypothetical protein [Pirellulales bacterium]